MLGTHLLYLELTLFLRNRAYLALMLILFVLMFLAAWNTHYFIGEKQDQVETQLKVVVENDANLMAQIDSLRQGLAVYEHSYTLPTSGVRLTYNNHRVAWLPFRPFSILAIGQGDIYSNYKKIVLYFNDSYEMSSEELISPLEQLFGQLDLVFVWVYILPLIIILISFNILSLERETGRLPLIASQPLSVSAWVLRMIGLRFSILFTLVFLFSSVLLIIFQVSVLSDLTAFGQLMLTLLLYCAFWFFLSFLINLVGYSSGKSLIVLTSVWVFFLFLVPSVINQLAKELITIPSRLEVTNHHQAMYNEIETSFDDEMEKLFQKHPDWQSDDPITSDLSNSTGWNINYLAKQYIAQLKHEPMAKGYERQVDQRNAWVEGFRMLSPAMIVQSSLTDIAGVSSRYYRSFLKQALEYARHYRQYVFKRVFTNHYFTENEIETLPVFSFDSMRVPSTFSRDLSVLLTYLIVVAFLCLTLSKRTIEIK